MAELTIKIPQLNKRHLALGSVGLVAAVVMAAVAILYLNRTTGLATIAAGKIEAFTPVYFAHDTPPDRYKVDRAHSQYDGKLLQITLTKADSTPVVLTEQARPDQLKPGALLANATAIKGALGPAGVIKVEGRVVGTMLPDGTKILVLVNASDNVSTDAISDILKSLRIR